MKTLSQLYEAKSTTKKIGKHTYIEEEINGKTIASADWDYFLKLSAVEQKDYTSMIADLNKNGRSAPAPPKGISYDVTYGIFVNNLPKKSNDVRQYEMYVQAFENNTKIFKPSPAAQKSYESIKAKLAKINGK